MNLRHRWVEFLDILENMSDHDFERIIDKIRLNEELAELIPFVRKVRSDLRVKA